MHLPQPHIGKVKKSYTMVLKGLAEQLQKWSVEKIMAFIIFIYFLLPVYVFYDILQFSMVVHLILNKYFIYIHTQRRVCVCMYELKPKLLLMRCVMLSLE